MSDRRWSQQGRLGPPESCSALIGPAAWSRRRRYRTMPSSRSRRPTCRSPEGPVPEIRPFRALRFDPPTVGDLAPVVAPPYDVIAPDEHARLLARHPAQRRPARPARGGRATSPTTATGARPGRSPRGARTGRCARTRTRRSTSTSRPTAVPGTDVARTQRGFFARLRLEPFGPDVGRPAARADARGPKEDRYKLLRATGVNTSPVVGLFDDPGGRSGPARRVDVGAGRRRAHRRRRRPPSAVGRAGRWRGRRRASPPLMSAAAPGRSPSPTATTATRRRCATATSGG